MKFCLCWGCFAFSAVELADVKGELAGCHAEVLPQASFFFFVREALFEKAKGLI